MSVASAISPMANTATMRKWHRTGHTPPDDLAGSIEYKWNRTRGLLRKPLCRCFTWNETNAPRISRINQIFFLIRVHPWDLRQSRLTAFIPIIHLIALILLNPRYSTHNCSTHTARFKKFDAETIFRIQVRERHLET